MALFNHATKEVTAKLVYYGPGLCGKTTNLQWIHDNLTFKTKGKLVSLATQTDRTLFFDFLPVELGTIRGMRTRMQIYTVPGQVFYEATRRMVLKGCDAVVFVADSQAAMLDANAESQRSLRQNLLVNEIDPEIPQVIQYNKRDTADGAAALGAATSGSTRATCPRFEAVAFKGTGVEETLKGVTKLLFQWLSRYYGEGAGDAASASAGTERTRRARGGAGARDDPRVPRDAARCRAGQPAGGHAPPGVAPPRPAAPPAPVAPTVRPTAPAAPRRGRDRADDPVREAPPRAAPPAADHPAAAPPAPPRPVAAADASRAARRRSRRPSRPHRPRRSRHRPGPCRWCRRPPWSRLRRRRAAAARARPRRAPGRGAAAGQSGSARRSSRSRGRRRPLDHRLREAAGEARGSRAAGPSRRSRSSSKKTKTSPRPPSSSPSRRARPDACAATRHPGRRRRRRRRGAAAPKPEPVVLKPQPVVVPKPATAQPAAGDERPRARREARGAEAAGGPGDAGARARRTSRSCPRTRRRRARACAPTSGCTCSTATQRGPIDVEDLIDLVLTSIPENTKVWHPGLEGWVLANQVREIADEIPPPIPIPGVSRGVYGDEEMPDFNTVPPMLRSVLIADEDAAFRKYLAMPLAAQGFTIFEAADGSAAWQLAVQNRPWMILADISMPEVDGFEFCRRVRNHPMLSRMPLLFISGSDKYKERYRALQIGADDFLSKNMPVRELLMRIQLLMTRYSDLSGVRAEGGHRGGRGRLPGPDRGLRRPGAPADVRPGPAHGALHLARRGRRRTPPPSWACARATSSPRPSGATSGADARLRLPRPGTKGSFKFTPGDPGEGEPLAQSVEHLLLEGCRLLDEAQQGRGPEDGSAFA